MSDAQKFFAVEIVVTVNGYKLRERVPYDQSIAEVEYVFIDLDSLFAFLGERLIVPLEKRK